MVMICPPRGYDFPRKQLTARNAMRKRASTTTGSNGACLEQHDYLHRYDALGRSSASSQTSDGQVYNFRYGYKHVTA